MGNQYIDGPACGCYGDLLGVLAKGLLGYYSNVIVRLPIQSHIPNNGFRFPAHDLREYRLPEQRWPARANYIVV